MLSSIKKVLWGLSLHRTLASPDDSIVIQPINKTSIFPSYLRSAIKSTKWTADAWFTVSDSSWKIMEMSKSPQWSSRVVKLGEFQSITNTMNFIYASQPSSWLWLVVKNLKLEVGNPVYHRNYDLMLFFQMRNRIFWKNSMQWGNS